MELRCVAIELEHKDDHVFLEPHGDHQIGSKLVDYDKLAERIYTLHSDPMRYTLIMGDVIDNIQAYAGGMIDKRWSEDVADKDLETTEKQRDKFIELYYPVKHKILGILSGNHEYKTIDRYQFEHDFCGPLETPYLGSMCMIHLGIYYKKQPLKAFEIWACHGSYAGMRVGGGLNRLQDLAGRYDADIYLHAHIHDKAFYTDYQITHVPNNNSLGARPKVYVITGTFQRTHMKGIDSYAERRAYPRVSKVGTITLDLDPLSGKIHVHE